jgi:MFS family permease
MHRCQRQVSRLDTMERSHPQDLSVTRRARTWFATWGPILPLLVAEATVWIGFGALLPILPLYFTEHGIDLPTLGIVAAAWPAANLIASPVFGWLADRTSRKLMMVIGLLLSAAFTVGPVLIVSPLAFIALRALAGLSAAIYDPAARGYLVDANPAERQAETFGLYGSAQMGGLMIGPAIGGVAAAFTGQPTIVFWLAGATLIVSAIVIAVRVPDVRRPVAPPETEAAEDSDGTGHDIVPTRAQQGSTGTRWHRPTRLFNQLLLAAIAFNVGSYFAGGTYEVVWSLYLTSLGAGLDAIGLTFLSFGLPVMLLSPALGRFIDRRGGFLALAGGMAGIAICGMTYPLVPEVWFVVVVGLIEGTAFAFLSPALFLLVSRASPPGRSSTAQGLFGAAGTLGTIVASLAAGLLADVDLTYPFYLTGIGAMTALLIGLMIGRRPLWNAMQPTASAPGGAVTAGRPSATDDEAGSDDDRAGDNGSPENSIAATPAPELETRAGA